MALNGVSDPDVRPRNLPKLPPGEEIVISGLAGRFPDSDNLKDLHQNLINKVDLVTDDDRRWKLDHPEIPQRTGKVNNIEKFDTVFFGVHFKQAHTMDPACRLLLEHAYEALIDAGVNPRQIRGTKTGVFIGACFSESEKTWFYDKIQVNGFGITGCARSMLSNRISYWLGITGPSYTIDTACSSSLYAFEHAYRAMREGLCDAALVGGTNFCLHPYVSMQFFKLGVLSTDGRCKTFDESANGYVRSEGVSVAFLQKSKDAKRIYATIVHGKINCDGYKEQGVTFPSSNMQRVLLKEVYMECGIPPTLVSYVEAHGTGTRVGDPEEVNAIAKVFTKGRTNPLLIGSVKSNLGHSEAASGIISVAKVILAMENGVLQPNLHFKTPRESVPPLNDGSIKVVTEVTPWKGGYAGVNSFGFGGANAHLLLKSNPKTKVNNGAPNDDLPRLVVVSGRTEDAVSTILTDLESKPVDVEYVKLLHDIHSEEINGHLYRGYTVLPPQKVAKTPIREIKSFPGSKRPVWFIFSGMGSQWPGMGESLLRIPVFAEAIKKCDALLKPRGIDIYHVITNKDKTAFDNILHSFVGIAAIQIGLVDILRTLNIEPDYMIGHSVGELGCAYADNCMTAEEMILASYSRGMASLESKFIHGSMAAVGVGYESIRNICPPDIDVACHNSAESSTISGPAESMKAFVSELQTKKIFAKEVACSNIPYHSRYITPAGIHLLSTLKKIIPTPKRRSEKWLSTSVPMSKWDTEAAKFSSAEYHTNNLLSAVLFEETSALIPKNAITIEIAPHGLLQAILRRSLDPSITNIPLTQRGHSDNTQFLLQAFGKLFNLGLNFQLANLYPRVEYPVSRSTQMISPLLKWEHSDDWYVTSYKSQQKIKSSERIVKISLSDTDYEPMAGHVIDGRNLFPATGYLQLVWETLGMMHGELYSEISVVFEDVKFLRATNIPKDGDIEFTLMIHKGSGRFEVVEGGAAVVSGFIRMTTNPEDERINSELAMDDNEEEELTADDIYKELRLRGYQYTGLFRSIQKCTISGSRGHISWYNNWVAFMDNMLQMTILTMDTRGLFVPTGIKKIVIDTKAHLGQFKFGELEKEFPVYVDKLIDVVTCGGVEICGLESSAIPRRKPAGDPVIEEYKFVPYADRFNLNLREIARLSTNICLENTRDIKVKTMEFIDERDTVSADNLLSPWLLESLNDIPLIQADVAVYSAANKFENQKLPSNVPVTDPKKITPDSKALITIGHNLLKDRVDNLNLLLDALKPGGFLLTRESSDIKNVENLAKAKGLDVVLEKSCGNEVLILFKKHTEVKNTIVINVNEQNFDWIKTMQETMTEETTESNKSTRFLYVAQGSFDHGLMGLINCLRKEPGTKMVRGLLIQDPAAPKFSLDNPFYAKQLEKDLVVNVLRKNNTWGSYRHLPLASLEPKPVDHMWITQLVRGDLSSLRWVEGPVNPNDKTKDIIRVAYSSINFKDVMFASGKLSVENTITSRQAQECAIGFEYCGLSSSGKRVMGIATSRGMANLCIAEPYLTWEIPDKWTYEDGATVPCVYATCYYALYVYGHMKKGDKVLIHAGTGGIGQAAIHLALNEGCEVFTTVSTPSKRQFIREHFPQIKDDHIGNSRDTSFKNMIMRKTNGRGVDIVLNSLSEEKLLTSVECLANRGRFLEIGKFDMMVNNKLGLKPFLREISFQGVMLDNTFAESTGMKEVVYKLVNEGLKNGAIKPLVRTVFLKDQVEAAFRFMAAGKHMGKVIIKVQDEKTHLNEVAMALPRYYCRPDRSYIILGGLGGFGLELADWLVLRGCKILVLTSRSGLKTGYQKLRINIWKSYGVQVIVIKGKDASRKEDCQFILETAAKLAPVDAIFNLAVVLKDALWDNQTPEYFEESFRGKAIATKNLDALSRKQCPLLRHFVVFSSVSCGRGNAGQINYGMANSVMERICERRVAENLPGLAIQWGAVGDVGLVVEMQNDETELVIAGTLQQRITSCLQELDGFLQQNKAIVSSMVVAEKKSGDASSLSLVDTVLNIMGLKDLKGVSPSTSFAELGMDSMMLVEIKQTLEREFEISLTTQEIRALNFSKLSEISEKDGEKEAILQNGDAEGETLVGMQLLLRLINNGDISSEMSQRLKTLEERGNEEVFLVPGVESVGSVFSTLAPALKASATCLQLGVNSSHKSIFDIADFYLPHVFKRLKKYQEYVLVGYSFGSLIAIEIARRLEAQGLAGRLILIDGAPAQLREILKSVFLTNSDVENDILISIMNKVYVENTPKLRTDLQKCKSWEEKLDAFTKHYPEKNLSVENQKALCTAIYKRAQMILNYDISNLQPLKSKITLLKPTHISLNMKNKDYDLSKVTSNKVEIHYIKGTHLTMLDNEKVAQIINGEVDEDPEAFKAQLADK